MLHLRSISPRRDRFRDGFPFSVPVVASLPDRLEIGREVLFLVGDNGSGKSTLLEAVALASERVTIGAEEAGRDATLDPVRPLADALRLAWRVRHNRGFFLRAEDFFSFSKRIRALRREMLEIGQHDQAQALIDRYRGDLDALSHGESFLRLFQSRIVPGGLYLIDEPEAALSPRGQLGLVALLLDAVERDCQFIVATHSAVVLSCPRAAIWEFADGAIHDRAYDDLDHVRFLREYLDGPERFLRHL